MSLRDSIQRIMSEYPEATKAPLEGHALARFLRTSVEDEVIAALGDQAAGLIVQGSPGQGNWAAVPWIAIFDPAITNSATRGFYAVYLFHADRAAVTLSLNQGTTATRQEFGSTTREILRDRAQFMRKRLSDFQPLASVTHVDLGSDARLPGDYAAGYALGFTYDLSSLPTEEALRHDLQIMERAYRALTFRGGLNAEADADPDVSDFMVPDQVTIVERRKYVFHKKIERNSTAARAAKKEHGTICQACNFDFAAYHGEIGEGFIEAHHLKPISSLDEGVAIKYEVAKDFAVLCANCHRMIHRTDDPSNLASFKSRLTK
jgi:5-methylcytosine-specific restriction protein A